MSTGNRHIKLGLLLAVTVFLLTIFGSAALAQDDAAAARVEFVGIIEAMTPTTITINGQVIDITDLQIQTPLALGAVVKVEATLAPDGRLAAGKLKADDDSLRPGEIEIVGKIAGMDGMTLIIAGRAISLSGAEVKDAVAIGQIVKIKVSQANDGSLTAREVQAYDDSADDNSNANTNDNAGDNANSNANTNDNADDTTKFDDDEFELKGTLTEIGDGYIVVSGIWIATSGAEIKGSLVPGALVEVKLGIAGDQFVAFKVEHKTSSDDEFLPGECVIAAPQGWTSYTIRAGDTLSSVAARSGADLDDLVSFNCITNPRMIVAGTVIFVPREPAPALDNANTNFNTNSNDNDDDDSNSNDNHDDNSNDNHDDDNGNDNHNDDNSNDNHDDDNSNDNHDDDNSNDNHDDDEDDDD
ncbi:MAG: hypothetical protein BroJett038_05980 [Chloroflexota bacterium]|nr:MAG: hypothetical protein BroJett038_05980 [Chloroflexota bacterium]